MKKLTMLFSLLCLTLALTVPASALEYDIDGPGDPEYGKPTSVEPLVTADNGAAKNVDLSKDAALMPPDLGGGGTLSPGDGAAMGYIPVPVYPVAAYTPVTGDLYYANNSLGTLSIPCLGVSVGIFEGTDSTALAKGAGHFEDSSIWNGNVCLAGHNRGANCYFGCIHTLDVGDAITYTTKLGMRTYSVVSVQKISETDYSVVAPTGDDRITLITCVQNQPAYRWCVQAVRIE